MSNTILVLNAGSSSLKFAVYGAERLDVLCRGEVQGVGREATLNVSGPRALAFDGAKPPADAHHDAITGWLLDCIRDRLDLSLKAAGHRVVHGGRDFTAPVLVNDRVLEALTALTPLAPGHQPQNLAGIRAVARKWPELPQIACFDTAFHRTQPRLAQLFPIPRELSDEGMLRYGFHGLSYQHIAEMLPDLAGAQAEGRVIVAHLGHGASLCAMKRRQSIATTMGFTALDGIMMGTRSGAVDPGLVLHLIRERGMSAADVSDMLNTRSGLLGVSGISDDVRVLSASSEPNAAEALHLFAYRAVCEAGSLIAALGGLDLVVFTAGIGEHSPRLRAAICKGLAFAGVSIDARRNNASEARINANDSTVTVFVIPANEELPIARAIRELV